MSAATPLIIEARVNEFEGRDGNPHVPWTAAEIAADAEACREAGAAVVHFHARRADGAAEPDPAACGPVIRAIRARSDILVHPTIGGFSREKPVDAQLAPILALARDPATRPDVVPLCLSSPNWDFHDPGAAGFRNAAKVYVNPTDETIAAVTALRNAGIALECVCWEVGAVRRLGALLDAGVLRRPAFAPFHFTGGGMLAGHPATPHGLDAYLAFLPPGTGWAAIHLHGSLLELAPEIIRRGGHIQIGLGDHHYAERGAPTNAALVRAVARMARDLGRPVATPAEAAAILQGEQTMRLQDVAQVIRSKNAGPRMLTLDIMFADDATFDRVTSGGALNAATIARLYGVAAQDVAVIPYRVGRAIKVSIPRAVTAGDPGDRDVYGAQQHAPLLGIEV